MVKTGTFRQCGSVVMRNASGGFQSSFPIFVEDTEAMRSYCDKLVENVAPVFSDYYRKSNAKEEASEEAEV